MFFQLLVASLVITSTVSGIITLVILFKDIPSAVLYSKAVFPLVLGELPVTFYNILPVGVAIAATWYYTNLVTDHTVDVLYATGVSYFSVILPALLLALLAVILGFYLSLIECPRGWSRILNAIYVGTHNIDPSKLEPQRFYHQNDNSSTLYFGRWLTNKEIGEVFVRERADDGGERSISAPIGEIVKTPNTTLLYLSDAVVEKRKASEPAPTIISLNRLWVDTGLRGSATPKRSSADMAELGLVDFAAAYNLQDVRYRREWTIEAFKRTIPPFLIVIYLLVGVRLALLGLGGRQESSLRFSVICGGLIAHHAVFLPTAVALIGLDGRTAWVIAGVIAAEIGVAIAINFDAFLIWKREWKIGELVR
jgi:lipopolysaccharide export system permease protein